MSSEGSILKIYQARGVLFGFCLFWILVWVVCLFFGGRWDTLLVLCFFGFNIAVVL